jgi:3-hydroxyisobutyrate dehydrogenase-like beta-hydroxyacid dehydrogenase
MTVETIGLLHPGDMGAGIGAALVGAGYTVTWASAGRSSASAGRAASANLVDLGSVEAMIDRCQVILSICPPAHAVAVANEVAGFGGLYLDANAIAPATARRVASVIEAGGGRYVDGGIIGGPPTPTYGPRLYLSGPAAAEMGELLAGTMVDARVMSEDQTAASGVKMCFAAWTKGTSALLLGIRALAIAQGVEAPLLEEWHTSIPELDQRSLTAGQQAATKGWRWVGEMEEIAATFRSAGLPDGFHLAAADIFARPHRHELAGADQATLRSVLEALRPS